MLYRNKRSAIWRVYFEHGGQPYDISTGESDHGKAETKASEIRDQITRAAGPGGRVQGIALEALEALDLKRANDGGNTAPRAITEKWKPVLAHFGPRRDGMSLTEAEIDTYVGARRAAGIRGQTIRKEVQALKRGFTRAERDGLISYSPIRWHLLDPIKSDPANRRQKSKRWSAVEVEKVLAHLSKKAVTAGIVDLIRFAQLTGLRFEELKRYDRDAWLFGRELRIPADGTKTHDRGARTITLSNDALAIAKRWPSFSVGKPNVALQLASLAAGFAKGHIPKEGKMRGKPVVTGGRVLTPRDMRAYFITQAAKIDLMAAQKLAGHTSIATTSRYLHPDEERIRQASLAASRIPTIRKKGGDTRRQKRKNTSNIKRARSSAG